MEVKLEQQNQDVDLMPFMQQIMTQFPPPTEVQALGEEEEISPLDEGPIMDIYSLTFDKLEMNIVQEINKHFVDYLTHSNFIKEKVNTMDTIKNPKSIAATKLAFT